MRFGRIEAWRLGVPSTGARPSGIGVRPSGIGVRLSGADMRIDGTSGMKPSGTSGVKPTGMPGEVKTRPGWRRRGASPTLPVNFQGSEALEFGILGGR